MKRAALILVAVGTLVSFPVGYAAGPEPPGAAPTFTKDVAPILYGKCVTCHRAGEIGPMPLVAYQDVRPWAKAIKAQVTARLMPPWGADPHIGRFKNDRSLTEAEIQTITAWTDAGAPKGNDADLPAVPNLASGWTRGEPDVVIEMPVAFEVPSEGQVDVTDFYVKAPFDRDVFVKALEIRPSAPAAVHHAGVYIVEALPQNARLENGRILDAKGESMSRSQIARAAGRSTREENDKLLSFVPGRGYEEYQAGAGQRIKAGSYINFYMHYQPTGKPEKDRTRVGLYLAKPGQDVTHQIYHSFGAAGPATYVVEGKQYDNLASDDDLPPIPPYVDNWKVVSVHAITEPVTIYGLTPHLHLRGKSMKYTLVLPDGREEVLLSVPRYDFNWQVYYELDKPRSIPAGSKVVVTTIFDNSPNNRYNPAPQNTVYWSEQSWDEMYAPQARITVDSRDLRKAKDPALTPHPQQER